MRARAVLSSDVQRRTSFATWTVVTARGTKGQRWRLYSQKVKASSQSTVDYSPLDLHVEGLKVFT